MNCYNCKGEKCRADFLSQPLSGALAAPTNDFPHSQLQFVCFHCLATTDLLEKACEAGLISKETHPDVFEEVEEWTVLSQQKMLTSVQPSNGSIVVLLMSTRYRVPFVAGVTTTKDVKLFIGAEIGREPKTIRLLFHHTDVLVKNKLDGTLHLLADFHIVAGDTLVALLPMSQFMGMSAIPGLATSADGNPIGDAASLGQAGGFRGKKAVIYDFYGGCGSLHHEPLQTMGFDVISSSSAPGVDDLKTILLQTDQLWIISGSRSPSKISNEHIDAIAEFNARGGGLYIWGDNDPFYVEANALLTKILPGLSLTGNYLACKHINLRDSTSAGPGFIQHPIFTGIVKLYEGETIAKFAGSNSRVTYIMNSSEGAPALGVVDDNHSGCGRIAVDCAFTRLFCKWDGAGTARFVSNIAAWLSSPDKDWA